MSDNTNLRSAMMLKNDEFYTQYDDIQKDKMSDEDKNMLPLKRIAFLGNNE